jgi:hypothetical protein
VFRLKIQTALNDAARGLAQQMVFWGHDVRHPEGNLLVRYGMKRSASPGLTGTSCYSMEWQGGMIELHGAVASWTRPDGGKGCLFSRGRARIDLWTGDRAPVPGREHGEAGDAEERWFAAQSLIAWLAAYEEWVAITLGAGWRSGCWRALKKLPKGKPWLSPEASLRWWKTAAKSLPPRPREFSPT